MPFCTLLIRETANMTTLTNARTQSTVPARTAPINARKALRAACIELFGSEALFPTDEARRAYVALRAEGTTQQDALELLADLYNVCVETTFCLKGTAKQENAWRAATIARTSTNRRE